ncbi:MAG: pilus assembly protein PilM [Gammaproteobacteria bacterium]|nr:pilus assembly protein PilM [Gammaproteobacteria bacterium]
MICKVWGIVGKRNRHHRIGISIQSDAFSVVLLEQSASGSPRIIDCRHHILEQAGDEQEILRTLGKEGRFKKLMAEVVMEPESYALLQVEAPEVAPDELRSAIQWRIKDLIDFHIDDAVLDYFEMPAPSRKGVPKLMYVVAARAIAVRRLVEHVESAGLTPNVIDITELALRNIAARATESDGFCCLLYLAENYGVIQIVKDETLYLNRRMEINVADFRRAEGDDSELVDSLLLELQRSLDYQESQYGLGQVREVIIAAPDDLSDRLAKYISETLPVSAKPLSENSWFRGLFSGIDGPANQYLPALGATLRMD